MSAIAIEPPTPPRRDEFLEAVRNSRTLHGNWVRPPATPGEYDAYLARTAVSESHLAYFVCTGEGDLAGVVNVSEIVRGSFCSAYLGYYALVPFHRKGYMKQGLDRVISVCFGRERLHRLEANIQPGNTASRRLVEGLGFRLEGLSPRYLRVAGEWRDHERWAITAEEWSASPLPTV